MKHRKQILISCLAASFIIGNVDAYAMVANYTLSDTNTTGYNLGDDINLTVTSTGKIVRSENNTSNVIIDVNASNRNTIVNNGSISVNVNSTNDDNSSAGGINTEDNATIINNGNIATVVSSEGNATSDIIAETGAINTGSNSSITNSGTITTFANAKNDNGDAYANNVVIMGDTNSTISNSGKISSTVTIKGSGGALNSGIETSDNSTITNTGTITATATRDGNNGRVYNSGVGSIKDYEDENNITLANSDTISVTTNSIGSGEDISAGVILGENANITNTGIVSVTTKHTGNGKGLVWSEGIYSYEHSILKNYGTIKVITVSDGNSSKIFSGGMDADENSSITNYGTITAIAVSDGNSSKVFSWGMAANGSNSSITNYGTIKVVAVSDGNSSKVSSWGMGADYSNSSITNYGTITAVAQGIDENSSASVGIWFGRDSNITNHGTITADIGFYSEDDSGSKIINTGIVNTAQIYALDSNLTNSGTINLMYKKGTSNIGKSDPVPFQHSNIGNFTQTKNGTLNIDVTRVSGGELLYPDIYVTSATIYDGSTIGVRLSASSQNYLIDTNNTIEGVIYSENSSAIDANASKINVVDNSPVLKFTASLNDDNSSLSLKSSVVSSLSTKDTPQAGLLTAMLVNSNLNLFSGIVQTRQGTLRGLNSGDSAFVDKHFWIKPFGMYTKQDDKDGKNGYDAHTYGLGTGIDGEYSEGRRAGIAFFYSNSDVDVNNLPQSNDINSYNLIAYGSNPAIDDKTTIFYQAGFGLQKNKTKRYVSSVAKTARADYTSKSFYMQLKASRYISNGDAISFIPSIKGAYRYYKTPSYSETGAGSANNMRVESNSMSQVLLGLSTDINYKIDDTTNFISNIGLTYDFNNDRPDSDVSFEATPGLLFHTTGIKNSALSYEAGLGLSKQLRKNLSANIRYNLTGKGSDFINHSVMAKFDWKF